MRQIELKTLIMFLETKQAEKRIHLSVMINRSIIATIQDCVVKSDNVMGQHNDSRVYLGKIAFACVSENEKNTAVLVGNNQDDFDFNRLKYPNHCHYSITH